MKVECRLVEEGLVCGRVIGEVVEDICVVNFFKKIWSWKEELEFL